MSEQRRPLRKQAVRIGIRLTAVQRAHDQVHIEVCRTRFVKARSVAGDDFVAVLEPMATAGLCTCRPGGAPATFSLVGICSKLPSSLSGAGPNQEQSHARQMERTA
jgi:hypothetical protein